MSYRLTPQAERDVEAIGDHIAAHNPRAALKLIARFHARWTLLADFPESGPRRPDIAPDERILVMEGYLALYRIDDGTVEIVRVLQGRRAVGPEAFG